MKWEGSLADSKILATESPVVVAREKSCRPCRRWTLDPAALVLMSSIA